MKSSMCKHILLKAIVMTFSLYCDCASRDVIHNLAPVLTWMVIVSEAVSTIPTYCNVAEAYWEMGDTSVSEVTFWGPTTNKTSIFVFNLALVLSLLASGDTENTTRECFITGPCQMYCSMIYTFRFWNIGNWISLIWGSGCFSVDWASPPASSLFDSLLKWSHAHRYKQTKIVEIF